MKRTLLGFGLASLVAVAFSAGCSSNGSSVSGSGGSNGNGSGGSNGNGSGGSNGSGSGGSNGSGGSGSGGSSGSGSGGALACAAASSMLIDDFSGSGGIAGGDPYFGADMGLMKPMVMVDTSAKTMTIMLDTGPENGTGTSAYPYAFVGLGFSSCADASSHTGVTFNVSGTLSAGCTIQFSAVDKEHNTSANGGTCTATSCYPSAMPFTLPSSGTDVTVNFLDQVGGGADGSAAVVDPKQLTAVQWQVNVTPTDVGSGCKGTVTIKNVNFK